MKKIQNIIEITSTLSKKRMEITRFYYPKDKKRLGFHCFFLQWDVDPTIHCGYCQHYHFSEKVYLWNTINFLDDFCKENVIFNFLQIDNYYQSSGNHDKYRICKTNPTLKDNFEDLFFFSLDFVENCETFFVFYCLMKKNKNIVF
jgi:hypothetical protein